MSDHDHYGEYAVKRHRHYDLEREDETAQEDIRRLREDVRELRSQLDGALGRIRQLDGWTPEARQAQYEADVAAADLAESGYDSHGSDCQCPYCIDEPEPEEYDPGPEADDESGRSEYRYLMPEDYERGQS